MIRQYAFVTVIAEENIRVTGKLRKVAWYRESLRKVIVETSEGKYVIICRWLVLIEKSGGVSQDVNAMEEVKGKASKNLPSWASPL